MRKKKHLGGSGIKASIMMAGLVFLGGCEGILNPKGQVGVEIRELIITSVLLMLIVVIPAILMTLWFAYRYRASNTEVKYSPDWEFSGKVEFFIWFIPILIIIALAIVTYKSTHSLDPRKSIDTNVKSMEVDVVSLDWKWLFIYPELGIATVNELAMPLDVPVAFDITSATVMNSFFIPQLGSQIYAMAGMENRLHLVANKPGEFLGVSANYSGNGFSGMNFMTHAVSQEDFDRWVAKVKSANQMLDFSTYKSLETQQANSPVKYFSTVEPGLFKRIVNQFRSVQQHPAQM